MIKQTPKILSDLHYLLDAAHHQDWDSVQWTGDSWQITVSEDGEAELHTIQSKPTPNGKFAFAPYEYTEVLKYECPKIEAIVVKAELFDPSQRLITSVQTFYDAHDPAWASKFISEAIAEAVRSRQE